MRQTSPSPSAEAHTPPPTATAERLWAPRRVERPARLVRGSIGVTDSVSSPLMYHTLAACGDGGGVHVDPRHAPATGGIDPGDRAVGVDRPDGPGPDRYLREAPVPEGEVAG